MFKKILEAYNKGVWAWKKGQSVYENPYDADEEEDHHWSWEQGWNTGVFQEEDDGSGLGLNL